MSARYPGIRFSIRPDEGRWRWRAMRDGVVLSEGVTSERAVAAACVIREICRACAAEADASAATLPKAA